MPQADGLSADHTHRPGGIDVVERPGKGDDANPRRHCGFPAYCPVLDHGVGQQRLGDLGKCRIIDGVVDLYLKPLALPHI